MPLQGKGFLVSFLYDTYNMETTCYTCGKAITKKLDPRNIHYYCNRECYLSKPKKVAPSSKVCIRCKKEKGIELFNINKYKSTGYGSYCKKCVSEQRMEYYYKNRDIEIHKRKIYKAKCRKESQDYIWDLKEQSSCEICCISDPEVLTFDHLDPVSKKYNISLIAAGGGCSLATLKKEIEKCRILCANCHLKHTRRQLGYRISVQE